MDGSGKGTEVTQTITSPPPAKKLKQARLPFAVIDPKVATVVPPGISKKRKLSAESNVSAKPLKTPKKDENKPKVNKQFKSGDEENEVSSSSEADFVAKADKALKDVSDPKAEKGKSALTLEKFIVTNKTQQEEVTTSTKEDAAIDLTSTDNEASNSVPPQPDSSSTSQQAACQDETNSLNLGSEKDFQDPNESVHAQEKDESNSDKNNSVVESDKDVSMVSIEADTEDNDDEESTQSSENSPDKGSNSAQENKSGASKGETTPKQSSKTKQKTPMSAKSQEQKQKRKEETERIRQEKQKQKDAEKETRKKQKEEKEQQKKEERERREKERQEAREKKEKERLEKLEQKEKERKEKEQQKEEERKEKLRLKEEEKKKKEELNSVKTVEKRKKDEEKKKEEEEKMKQAEKAKQAFASFFSKSKAEPAAQPVVESTGPFMAFEMKKDMRIAPVLRVDAELLSSRSKKLDKLMLSQDTCKDKLYVQAVKHKTYKRGKASKTWPREETDVMVVDEETPKLQWMHAKFLKFHENYRPPYYGTWKKRSKHISPKCPLRKDEALLDYEVDSDDEWEEEEPGESLSHSEGEGDDEEKVVAGDDDDEDEDGFFVPHGYLSEGEGCEEEEEDNSPEKMKAKMLARQKAWDAEMKKTQLAALKPIYFGCCWWSHDMATDPATDLLKKYQVRLLVPQTPIPINKKEEPKEQQSASSKDSKEKEKHKNFKPVPEEVVPDLVRLVHGNSTSIQKLIKEFREYSRLKASGISTPNPTNTATDSTSPIESEAMQVDVQSSPGPLNKSQTEVATPGGSPSADSDKPCTISKRQIEMKIRSIAVYEKREAFPKNCWYVSDEIMEKYELKDLPVPTEWEWVTKAPKTGRSTPVPKTGRDTPTQPSTPSLPSIKQFTVPKSQLPKSPPRPPKIPEVTTTPKTPVIQKKGISAFLAVTPKSAGHDSNKGPTPRRIESVPLPKPVAADDEDDCMIVEDQPMTIPERKPSQPSIKGMFSIEKPADSTSATVQ